MSINKDIEEDDKEMITQRLPPQFWIKSISAKAPMAQNKAESGTLPPDFEPSNWTVICGRGKDNYSSIGNKRLKVLVDTKLPQYQQASTKIQKSLIVSELVDTIHEAAGDSGFVKRDPATNRWVVVSEETAREKVSNT